MRFLILPVDFNNSLLNNNNKKIKRRNFMVWEYLNQNSKLQTEKQKRIHWRKENIFL